MTTIPDSDDEMLDFFASTLIRAVALGLAVASHGAVPGKDADGCFVARAEVFEEYLRGEITESAAKRMWDEGIPLEGDIWWSGQRLDGVDADLCGDAPDKDTRCERPVDHPGLHAMNAPGVDRPIKWGPGA